CVAERPTTSPNVPVCLTLKKKVRPASKEISWRIAKQFREASPYCPMIQNAKMLKAKSQKTRFKGFQLQEIGSGSSRIFILDVFNDFIYRTHLMCFWLAQERGRKTKATKLIAGGIGSTWVQLKRVNPSPSPTHSARESEWAKAEAVLKAATQCSRETELIRGTAPLGLDPNLFGWVILLLYDRRHLNLKLCLDYANIMTPLLRPVGVPIFRRLNS
ncbi:hypothetical protein H5410_045669, partial [Solanum commersonii]